MSSTDCVRVSTVVALEPSDAFEVFTEEVDSWWRRGPRFRWNPAADGVVRFEPGAGGRLVEEYAEGEPFEVGRVSVWEPAERLVFGFRARAFGAGDHTEVEVRFEAVEGGTRVTVEHRGWDSLPADHPVRHGLAGEAFTGMMGTWWGELLVSARAHAAERGR